MNAECRGRPGIRRTARGAGRAVLALCAAALLAPLGCAASGMRLEAAPAPGVAAKSSEAGTPAELSETPAALREEPGVVSTALLVVETGGAALGAFELALEYDPRTTTLEAVLPAGSGGATRAPLADPSNFPSGRTAVAGFQVAGPYPKGRVVVARLRYISRGAPSRPFAVSIRALYGPGGEPLRGAASAEPGD